MTQFETFLKKMDYEVISKTYPTELNGPFTEVQSVKIMIDFPSATTNNFDIPNSPAEIERLVAEAVRVRLPTNVVFGHNLFLVSSLTLQHRWGLRNRPTRRTLVGHFTATKPVNSLVFENMIEEELP